MEKVKLFVTMKGIHIIKDETSNKRFLQLDMEYLQQHPEEVEDILDVVTSELRKDEEEISWEELKKELSAEWAINSHLKRALQRS